MVPRCLVAVASILLGTLLSQAQPSIDYHQHLLSPPVARLGSLPKPFTAHNLISLLDAAGVQRALVLSLAYQYGNPNKPPVPGEYAQVQRENDWTARQVSKYPNRLRAFCGVNPLRPYAVLEVERCAKNPFLHYGLKLHFGNSDVDMDDPHQVAQLRLVFRCADEHGMAIVIHMRSSVSRNRPYGARQANIFLNEVLPAAPHVPIQIAHLAGAGGFDDPSVDSALSVFIDAIAREDTRMANVYFDLSAVAGVGRWQDKKALIVERIRQIGLNRILWGSDGSFSGGISPTRAVELYQQLPLTKEEFHTIDTNLAPYMR